MDNLTEDEVKLVRDRLKARLKKDVAEGKIDSFEAAQIYKKDEPSEIMLFSLEKEFGSIEKLEDKKAAAFEPVPDTKKTSHTKGAPDTKELKREATEDIPVISFVEVAKNTTQPAAGTQAKNFIDVGAFPLGSYNVILPGPFVNFWCQDCGRLLAPRSIHDHWQKAHDGDKFNLKGCQNVAAYATSYVQNRSKVVNKKAKVDRDTGVFAGVHTKGQKSNPFYVAVSKIPKGVYVTMSENQLNEMLENMKSDMTKEEFKAAQNMIKAHFSGL